MEQQDVFYDGAEYIETVSVGINSLRSFTTTHIMHGQIILSRTAPTVTVFPLGFWEQGQ